MLADLHIDPTSATSWRTARWLTDIADARGLEVRWRPHSRLLADDVDATERADLEPVHRALRVAERAREEHGDVAVNRFYAELTRRLQEDGLHLEEDDLDGLLIDVGLDPVLVAAAIDPAWDAEIEIAMEEAADAAGATFAPVVVVGPAPDRTVITAPIPAPVPTGDAALALFDGLTSVEQDA